MQDIVATAEHEIIIFERPSLKTSLSLIDEVKSLRAVLAKALAQQEPVGICKQVTSGEKIAFIFPSKALEINHGDKLYAEPRPAQAASIPDKIKPATRTLESIGYANGWNDCVDLMISASPKPE